MADAVKWQSYGLSRWRRHLIPVVVWLAASGGAVWLFAHRAQRCELVGIARGEQRQVAALTNGRLRMVPVVLFEAVKAGQTLAVLEDDRIRAALATAEAETARLRAELVATENRLTAEAALQDADQMAEARRFAIDVEGARLRELELRVALETDRITSEFLRLQAELLGSLREKRAVSELQFRSAETQYAALKRKIDENEKVLAQARIDLERARQRQELFAQHHPVSPELDKALEPLRAALTVQEHRIGELALERSMLVLASPMDGVVSELLRGVGEALLIGEPILTVTAAQPSEVIAYATPAQADQLETGAPVRLEVTREDGSRQVADSQVASVGPVAQQLPMQLWQNPTLPEWGWPVKIAIPAELRVLCDELVGVRGP